MNKIILFVLLIFLVLTASVNAYTITTNNASQSIWNETFTGNQNNTFWISIQKQSYVYNGQLNLSGFNYNYIIPNSSGSNVDADWNGLPNATYTFINTTDIFNTTANITVRSVYDFGTQFQWYVELMNLTNRYLCGNGTYIVPTMAAKNFTLFCNNIISGIKNVKNITYFLSSGTDYRPYVYNSVNGNWSNTSSKILQVTYINYTSATPNPYLDVSGDGDAEWSFSGAFNQLNNRTSDFSTELNNYLPTCSANSSGYCNVPFRLHSNSTGIIQISDINITYGINITNCTSGNPFITFNGKNEETNNAMNYSQDMTLTLNNGYDLYDNKSFEFRNQTNYSICIYPSWATYQADSTSKYYATGFSDRYYYLDNATLTNNTQNINLYLHNSTNPITFYISNEQGLGQSNIIIQVQRWFIGTGTYLLVAEGLTDNNGYSYINLKPNDWYKYILIQNRAVAKEFSTQYLNTTDVNLAISSLSIPSYFNYWDKVAYSCIYSNATNVITCTYSDISGEAKNVCLQVDLYTMSNKTNVCNQCSNSSSSTLICSLPAGNNTYKANLYGSFCCSTTSYFILWQQWIQTAGTITSRFGSIGVLIAFILIMLMFFVGLWNYAVSIVLGMFGLTMSYTFGLLNITQTTITTLIGMVVIGAIIIYEMRT